MSKVHNVSESIEKPLLTHDQLQRELSYRVAISILKEMRKKNLISSKEFVAIAPIFEKKFSPVWGQVYQSIA